ncbi:MAG: hypothetical protein OHK0029_25590 [Armatimonadaceae bacterium]
MAQLPSFSAAFGRNAGVLFLGISLTLGLGTKPALAQLFSWSGTESSLWKTPTNWEGKVAPPLNGGSSVQLLFDGSPAVTTATNDLGNFFLNQMRFGATAAAYTVNSATPDQFLNFTPDTGVTPSLINDSSSIISLLHNISFDSGLNIGGTGSGTLFIAGTVVGQGVLTKSGPGTLTIESPLSNMQLSQLLVTGGTFNITGGTKVLASTSTTSNLSGATIHISGKGSELNARFNSEFDAHTNGTIQVTDGGKLSTSGAGLNRVLWGRLAAGRTVVVDGAGSLWEHTTPTTTQPLQVRGSQTSVTVQNGGAMSTTGQLFVENNAVFTVNGGTATVSSLESLDNTGLLQLSDAGGSSALTITNANSLQTSEGFDGIITDAAGGPGSITLLSGQQVFTGINNTFSGGTRLLGGVLQVAGNGSLGTGGVTLNGGTLIYANTATLNQPLTFGANGGGLGAFAGATLTIDQSLNLTAPLTIAAPGTVRLTGANQYNTINLFTGTLELTNNADATLSGQLLGANGTLVKTGTGILTLTQGVAAGVNAGASGVVVNEGVVRLTHADALQGSYLTLNRNDAVLLDLGANPQIINMGGLFGSGNINLGNHSLYINNPILPSDFAGSISGTGSVTLEHGGALTGANTYTGGTFFGNGTLTINAGGLPGDITWTGGLNPNLVLYQPTDGTYSGNINFFQATKTGAGKLTLLGDFSHVNFTLQEGTLALTAGANGEFVNSSTVFAQSAGTTFQAMSNGNLNFVDILGNATVDTNGFTVYSALVNGSTSNQAVITKSGGGTWEIGSVSAYGLRIEQGEVQFVEPTGGLPGLPATYNLGDVTVSDGATLRGDVTISDFSSNRPSQILLLAGGTLAPGLPSESVGTLGVTNLIWDDGGILAFDLSGNGISDRVVVSSSLLKGAAGTQGFYFDFTGATPVDGGLYGLLSFSTTDFVASDFGYYGLHSGASGIFEMQGNSLVFRASVSAAPEPQTGFLLGSLLVLIALIRNRCEWHD